MNLNEVKKIVTIQIILYILIGLCFIVSMIAILVTPVKAKEITNTININSKAYMPCGSTQYNGKYCAYLNNGTYAVRNTNTTYNGVLNGLTFQFGDMISTKPQYTMVIEAMSTDFRNNSFDILVYGSSQSDTQGSLLTNYTYSFISKSKLQIIFTTDTYSFHTVIISGNPLTGINTYGIKKVTLSYDDGVNDNSDIINNNNQNTNDIIDNANSNTEEITNKITETFNQMVTNGLQENNNERRTLSNMCKNIYYTEIGMGKTINSGGALQDLAGAFYMTDYVAINIINDNSLGGNANRIYIQEPNSSTAGYYFAFYDNNKTLISVERTGTRSLTIPSNAVWFRFSSTSSNTTVLRYSNKCIEATDQVYGLLSDDTNPNINQSGIDDVLSEVEISDPLNYLLTLPISLLQKLNAVLSANSCSRVSFGSLYNTELYLPCINFEQLLGSNIWGTIDLIVGVGLLVIILKKFYNSISNILTLGKEKEVRDKLDLPTPMQFLANILGGGKE